MHRGHTFFSPLGVILSILFLLGLALIVWYNGGSAFSPGRLTAVSHSSANAGGFRSHADFEGQCERCHQPGGKVQTELCLDCHADVAAQLSAPTALHAGLADQACAACHPDHRGRNFDISAAAQPKFDHSSAGFSLIRHSLGFDLASLGCQGCHDPSNPDYAADLERCTNCHGQENAAFMTRHLANYGAGCTQCHDGLDSLARFDHSQTPFPLDGKHSSLSCSDCHKAVHANHTGILVAGIGDPGPSAAVPPSPLAATGVAVIGIGDPGAAPTPPSPVATTEVITRFSGLSTDCQSCHTEPAAHHGLFSSNCAACHTTAAWQPASFGGAAFDHNAVQKFSLAHHAQDYAGAAIACTGCHIQSNDPATTLSTDLAACTTCHAAHDPTFMQNHLVQAGPNCLECHDGRDRMSAFDHAKIFVLDGQHAGLICRDCHTGGFGENSVSDCVHCHAEPPIHAGYFGLKCQDCHTGQAWSPARLLLHHFPLDHGAAGQVACQTCHPSNYITYTCYSCHDHQPADVSDTHLAKGIAPDELQDCAACHPDGLKE